MMPQLTAAEIPWPPPVGVPYKVIDGFGSYIEVVQPGAYEDAKVLRGVERAFQVAEDEWSEDFGHRFIKRFAAVSEQ